MKKNFDNVASANAIYDAIATGTQETEPAADHTTAATPSTPVGMGTQGRKGQKLARYNLGLTAENKEFIQIYAAGIGQTQNALINAIIDAYRREHPAAVAAVARAREAWDIIGGQKQ